FPDRRARQGNSSPNRPLPAEMYEQAAEVLRVLLHPVVFRFDLFLLEKPQHALLELARALTGDDLDERGLLRHRLVDDRLQRPVDVLLAVVDVVQVKLQLHGHRPGQITVMISSTVAAGSSAGTTVSTRSSGAGGSRASNCELSSCSGKKCPCRDASRRASTSRSGARKTIRAAGR